VVAGVYVFDITVVLEWNTECTLQAVGVLQTLHPGDYHVTVISPDTFTTFTPLLPCKISFTMNQY
jgi:hypothetical protein